MRTLLTMGKSEFLFFSYIVVLNKTERGNELKYGEEHSNSWLYDSKLWATDLLRLAGWSSRFPPECVYP